MTNELMMEEKVMEIVDEPELAPEDMMSLLYILIARLGGKIQVKHGVFEELKGGVAPVNRMYDKQKGTWYFTAAGSEKRKKRKRGIITPSRKIMPVTNDMSIPN